MQYALTKVLLPALLLVVSSGVTAWSGDAMTTLRSQSLDISRAGSEATRRLLVTEDRRYVLSLKLGASEGRQTRARQMLSIPLHVEISMQEAGGEHILSSHDLEHRVASHGHEGTGRIGSIDLPPGLYRLTVRSGKDAPELRHVTASVEVAWRQKSDAASRMSPAMTALMSRVKDTDLLNHLGDLQQWKPGATNTAFLRAESFAIPEETGVLDPCSHRMHLHHESGHFWIVRRCTGGKVDIFHGTQPGMNAPRASAQGIAFRRN